MHRFMKCCAVLFGVLGLYELSGTTDKMAGLIGVEAAFQNDVCVIEWPSRMPDSVMQLQRRYAFCMCWLCMLQFITCHLACVQVALSCGRIIACYLWPDAFQSDVCVIEWPSRMPDSVMQLPRR
jgi:hypothetical protein